ncbi:hypothetical protein C1H70_17545 [Halomonas urumqiensis]|uniref:Uncharacterized protein n=1 Tax=Halomonas urumqiensis TaxID=1684789 RepID=A0A2N7UE56_9GAMM|nr:hypothetical protein C1H70_17545 [Halomonas urumqiensis]PTB04320.1 hypothetical protein C6V82_04175 [Halomonas urumqiensis]
MLVLVLVLVLVGCSGSENDPEADQQSAQTSEVDETGEQERRNIPAADPFDEPVEIEFEANLRSDRRLMVEGRSNLPDGAQFQVVVEREASGVRMQSRTFLEEGRFVAGPFGSGSGLPDGGYRITVNLPEATVQPEDVQQRIGQEGEHLSGPLVGTSRHGLGRVASATRRFLVGNETRRTSDQVDVIIVD